MPDGKMAGEIPFLHPICHKMYNLTDTTVAISSPSSGPRTIVRISGPATIEICKHFFSSPIDGKKNGLITGSIIIDNELKIDAMLYLFPAPFSYTGDDVAEIHIHTNRSVVEVLMENLLNGGLRMAGPGEFTARAYLNGKMDLAQAEAVNEVVVSSNAFQLAAAEKLLSGRLSETTTKVQAAMMDCLSLIEAGLDFSGETSASLVESEAAERLIGIKQELEQLLAGSIRYESVVDLPTVGIAGAPNAGKSSMLNKLLGQKRSIVSDERKTTRDVLTGLLTLTHCRCVLFDCAGLLSHKPDNVLDELTQEAAIGALRNSTVVMFCVDTAKEDWSEDIAIRELIEPKELIPIATKSDLLSKKILANRLASLNKLFGTDFLATSVENGTGIEELRQTIDRKIIELFPPMPDGLSFSEDSRDTIAITVRHRQAVTNAIENINEAVNELKAGNDEVAAMMVRAAYQAICDVQQPACGRLDDEILERIFSRFCIGK
jgi:tRNA modification GTPase